MWRAKGTYVDVFARGSFETVPTYVCKGCLLRKPDQITAARTQSESIIGSHRATPCYDNNNMLTQGK
jgi:hypothetical protein